MPRIAVQESASGKIETREYSFTVVFEPVSQERSSARRPSSSRKVRKFKAPAASGYQVTAPLLPGLITYGRTLAEAREMGATPSVATSKACARMASASPTKNPHAKEKMRVALSA